MRFPEQFRWATAPHGYSSQPGDPYGWFIIPGRAAHGRSLACLATDGEETGWEHVSVSIEDKKRCASWAEMCVVKSLFWEAEETVVQFHPPESEYVNNHEGCLHLWRSVNEQFPLPPSILVGYKQNQQSPEPVASTQPQDGRIQKTSEPNDSLGEDKKE